jgi:hypothetical protein
MDWTVDRLRAEFLAMPGLHLTARQAQRLCSVGGTTCREALEHLVAVKFLCIKENGSYSRFASGAGRPVSREIADRAAIVL